MIAALLSDRMLIACTTAMYCPRDPSPNAFMHQSGSRLHIALCQEVCLSHTCPPVSMCALEWKPSAHCLVPGSLPVPHMSLPVGWLLQSVCVSETFGFVFPSVATVEPTNACPGLSLNCKYRGGGGAVHEDHSCTCWSCFRCSSNTQAVC
jgi:hypothetical protein